MVSISLLQPNIPLVMPLFIEKFPEVDGYEVTCTCWETIKALSEGNVEVIRIKAAERAEKGRAHARGIPNQRSKSPDVDEAKEHERMLKRAREVVVTVANNIDILVYGVGAETVDQTFELADADDELQTLIASKFAVDYDVIKFLFAEGIINKDLVELLWETV